MYFDLAPRAREFVGVSNRRLVTCTGTPKAARSVSEEPAYALVNRVAGGTALSPTVNDSPAVEDATGRQRCGDGLPSTMDGSYMQVTPIAATTANNDVSPADAVGRAWLLRCHFPGTLIIGTTPHKLRGQRLSVVCYGNLKRAR